MYMALSTIHPLIPTQPTATRRPYLTRLLFLRVPTAQPFLRKKKRSILLSGQSEFSRHLRKVDLKSCSGCGKIENNSEGGGEEKLFQCSRCQVTYYCRCVFKKRHDTATYPISSPLPHPPPFCLQILYFIYLFSLFFPFGSKECQRTHWRSSHRQTCCKPANPMVD